MLCDVCGKNPATVHLTEIIDSQMAELHLCEECARQKNEQMEQHFGLSDLLGGLAEFEKPAKEKATELVVVKCPNCGQTYADFKKIGRLGCSVCYTAFRKYLSPLLKRIHGCEQHLGKSPLTSQAVRPGRKKIDLQELRAGLAKAVEAEAFEEAAKLRDQIRELEQKEKKG